ncbi:hypothetical protein GCM10007977_039240 [Dactylosporangium sucinum]|uniref:Uncharacterized protein n=2 Tax=Dactylosporangium sucinum TaxID=1424081 RepID=A0A917TQV9_9ACTN|nr:hypothetical protein GCM10007977_039240 [Dactylosporangium sucinum]
MFMSDTRLAEFDALPTEELRERAFALARQRRDVKFFWDVFSHVTRSNGDTQDGWLGSLDATIDDVVALWREATDDDHEYGDAEPLVRAAFIDYLMSHS